MNIGELGKRVSYTFEDGETVEGWLYGELPQGILVAIDREGNDIRLIRKRWTRSTTSGTPEAAFSLPENTSDELRELARSIGPRFESSFERLDFKPFQRFRARSARLWARIRNSEELLSQRWPYEDDEQESVRVLEHVLYPTEEVLELHRDVFEELDRVEILSLVADARGRLPKIPYEYLLPLLDAVEQPPRHLSGEFDRPWNAEHHRSLLNEVSTQNHLWAFLGRSKGRSKKRVTKEEAPRKAEPSKHKGDGIRYGSAILRVLSGTGLAAANVGAGLTGGLWSTLITIGATTIPTAVGVVASVGTGMAQVSDGLEKIGTLQNEIASR
jgi:hypothetical protein